MPAFMEWTAELARALPDDGKRYEVLDGDLVVSPAPRWDHQRVVLELAARLSAYCRSHGVGEVLIAPSDIEFSSRRLVQPDMFVVPATSGRRPADWNDVRALLLVVEVVSPATARADKGAKRLIYGSERVPEYWILDSDARIVERWRPDDERPEVLSERLVWHPRLGLAPFLVDLPEFFAAVLD